jgi:hypothetical protein
VVTCADWWFLYSARLIRSTPIQPISVASILTLSFRMVHTFRISDQSVLSFSYVFQILCLGTRAAAGAEGWQPYRHLRADCLDIVGSLTSHNPVGLHGLLHSSISVCLSNNLNLSFKLIYSGSNLLLQTKWKQVTLLYLASHSVCTKWTNVSNKSCRPEWDIYSLP